MRRIVYAALVILTLSCASGAVECNSFHGYVTSHGEALAGVKITAINEATGKADSTVTRSDGSFWICLPEGYYKITATASGYATRTVPARVTSDKGGPPLQIDLAGPEP